MSEQVLRDRSGKLLGKIRETNYGQKEVRDASGNLRGTYDPKANVTRDRSGRQVGSGDQLSSLVK